ncbi:MAG: hypothetical protein GC149_01050 [Gammaproteobacteria bacterium]|nr:hypothetical protein [Gammaproteobacteria bacterium]
MSSLYVIIGRSLGQQKSLLIKRDRNQENGTRMHRTALILLLAMFLSACAANKGGFNSSELPTESEVSTRLAEASLPKELRTQIIRLHSREPQERAAAAGHLGNMGLGAAAAVPYLVRLLADNTPVQLSQYLGGGYYSSTETTPGDEASRALGEIGDPASNALLFALQDTRPEVRRLAAKALGQIGDIRAIDFLIGLLSDPDRGVRATAAIALGNYRHPMAAQKIMDAYPAAGLSARVDLIFALAHINDILAVPFLMQHAKDPEPDIRAAIMLALGKLRDARVIPALLQGVQDSDEITRANAAYSLGMYYSPAVVDALIKALADSAPRVREAALESLTTMTGMDYGNDQNKWQTWWREQRQQMQTPR